MSDDFPERAECDFGEGRDRMTSFFMDPPRFDWGAGIRYKWRWVERYEAPGMIVNIVHEEEP